ncbi:MAG: hypothetical protein JO246_05955 [Frankiaceae bacterium]|nr:hypothetical protein [Frankiaceae bacterium]MBV9871553.1 hypothetical protein [Frankiaceae bacterium]
MSAAEQDPTIGASRSLIDGDWEWPVHGLRHPPADRTSGWYVWTGDLSHADDFFQPWHTSHLVERVPQLASLLDLPPGSRFLIAPDHLDTWKDPSLLDV